MPVTAAYYVALLVVASGSAPALHKGVNLAGANVAIGSGPRPCFDQTGQSDLPATATPADAAIAFWFGLS